MRYFKFLTVLFVVFFTVACNQEADKPAPSAINNTPKTPLEQQINKVTNTVLIEPLSALQNDSDFLREKRYITDALDNSTQKDIFFACDEFKKSLLKLLQTDYSTDFLTESWQRAEIEKLSQRLAKEQCANIYTLRADFLADLQHVLNTAETKNTFLENTKPVIENYAKNILENNNYYTDIFNRILEPYKKLRQTFYPLEKAGYNTYILEQNAFKNLSKAATPTLQGKNFDGDKINQVLNKAQEEEKVLFVFLKKYESLTQTNGECINQFFPGLKDKWYQFMYEIEKLPADKRQAYADKRFNQANEGLKTKCADLLNKSNKKNTTQIPQEQTQQKNYQEEYNKESEESEEIYDF